MISAHRRGWGQVAVRCNRLCYCIRGLPLSQAASPFYGTLPRFGGAFSVRFSPLRCVQPTVRLGVGVVGLLSSGEIGRSC